MSLSAAVCGRIDDVVASHRAAGGDRQVPSSTLPCQTGPGAIFVETSVEILYHKNSNPLGQSRAVRGHEGLLQCPVGD